MNLHGASWKYTITPGEANHSPPVRDPSVVPRSQQAEAPALVQHLRPSQGVWDFPGLDPPGFSLSHIWHLLPEDRAPPPVHTVLWLCPHSPSLPTPGVVFPWNVQAQGWCPGQASHQIYLQMICCCHSSVIQRKQGLCAPSLLAV